MADSPAPNSYGPKIPALPLTKLIVGATPVGASLKGELVSRLRKELGIEVEDLGTDFAIAGDVGRRVSSSHRSGVRGLVVCSSDHIGSILANKFPGAFATACPSVVDAVAARSICSSNILVVSPNSTPPAPHYDILRAWLYTPFKSPWPASDVQPGSDGIQESLDLAQFEMAQMGGRTLEPDGCVSCAICRLANPQVPNPFEMIPGGSVEIIAQNPVAAIVRFEDGSVEPPHHHTSPHDQVVLKGKMSVWNLSKKMRHDLVPGDYLFTPGGDVHMVKYREETEFVIKWYGHCDMFFDQDLDTAEMAQIGGRTSEPDGCVSCAICRLANSQVPNPFEMIPGGSVKIIAQNPVAAIVRFEDGSVEPPHHHTSPHDRLVLKGKMSVWNSSKNKRHDLGPGDCLFTPGGDVHMAKYREDTEFFIKWCGHCDMFFHQDLDTAEMAID